MDGVSILAKKFYRSSWNSFLDVEIHPNMPVAGVELHDYMLDPALYRRSQSLWLAPDRPERGLKNAGLSNEVPIASYHIHSLLLRLPFEAERLNALVHMLVTAEMQLLQSQRAGNGRGRRIDDVPVCEHGSHLI
ncbi:hypothetical protein DT070_00110 [Polaromonas sp. SP1]|nr:hypothetical protein DT070_00110 [Polaromonas sp. SP1]